MIYNYGDTSHYMGVIDGPYGNVMRIILEKLQKLSSQYSDCIDNI